MTRIKKLLLILLFQTCIAGFAQKSPFTCFVPFRPEGFDERFWYLDSLINKFDKFIVLKEASVWGGKSVVDAIATKKRKAYLVQLTSFILDTPQNKMHSTFIKTIIANRFLDTLDQLGFCQLKDESQIPICISNKDTIIRGQRVISQRATTFISDGLHSTIIVYSRGKFRVTRFYELDEASSICPELKEWKYALQVRRYLKQFFVRHTR